MGAPDAHPAGVLLARPHQDAVADPSPPPRLSPRPPVAGGIGSAIGFGSGIGATIIGAVLGATSTAWIGLALLTATAVGVAATTTVPGALGTAIQCWALWDGFLSNRFGQLTLAPDSWHALLGMIAAAVLTSLAASGLRHLHAARTAIYPATTHPRGSRALLRR